jgi:hypothetical protein
MKAILAITLRHARLLDLARLKNMTRAIHDDPDTFQASGHLVRPARLSDTCVVARLTYSTMDRGSLRHVSPDYSALAGKLPLMDDRRNTCIDGWGKAPVRS